MSGLVKFLKDTLVSPSGKASEVEYSESLLTRSPDEENIGEAVSSKVSLSITTTTNMAYAEWKECCNATLSKYLSLRFDEDANEEEEKEEASSETHLGSSNSRVLRSATVRKSSEDSAEQDTLPSTQPEIMEPETQEPPAGFATPSPSKKQKKIIPIPHASLTCHKATSISEMNMYTETLNLDLCEVVKVYPMRSTRRLESMFKNNLVSCYQNRNDINPFTNDIIVSFPPLQNHKDPASTVQSDGPLFSLYKRVMSMEVLELETSASTEFLGNQHNMFGHSKPPRRFVVYLYNDYATFMDAFLDSASKKGEDLYLALKNIPGCCIIPFCAGNQTFLNMAERDLSPYVLGLGGPSKAVLNKTNDRLSFESDSLEITIVSTNPDESLERKAGKQFSGAQICPEKPDDTNQAQEQLYDRVMQWKNKSSLVLPESATNASPKQTPPKKRTNEEQIERSPLKTPSKKKQRSNSTDIIPTTKGTGKDAATADGIPTANDVDASDAASGDNVVPIVEGYEQLAKVVDVLTQHRNSPRKHRKTYPSANVIGVIWAFSQPSRTKRNSWTMSVNLIDPSIMHTKNDDNIDPAVVRVMKLQIFRNKRGDLPTHTAEPGNLIVIKGAGVQEYMGDIQLLGRTTTRMQVIVPSADRSPYREYNAGQWKSMKQLWKWGQQQFAVQTTLSDTKLKMQLQDLPLISQPPQQERPDDISSGDYTVMISSIFPSRSSPNTGPIGYLRVWDGTGAPISDPLPAIAATSELIQTLRKSGDPPIEALVKIKEATAILNNKDFSERSFLQETVVLTGRVVNVAVWELAHWEYLENHCHVGMFFRLRNAQKEDRSQQGSCLDPNVALQIHAKTWVYPLPPQTFEVRRLLEEHENRVKRKEPHNPSSGLLPVDIPHIQQPPSIRNKASAQVAGNPKSSKTQPSTDELMTLSEGLQNGSKSPVSFVSHFYVHKISPHKTLKDLVTFHEKKKAYKYAFITYIFNEKGAQKEATACLCDTKAATALLGGVSPEEAFNYDKGDDDDFLTDMLNPKQQWKGWFVTKIMRNETFLICKDMKPI